MTSRLGAAVPRWTTGSPPSQARANRWDAARPSGQAPRSPDSHGEWELAPRGPGTPPPAVPPPSAPPDRGESTCARQPHAESAFWKGPRPSGGAPTQSPRGRAHGALGSPDPLPGFCPEHPGFPGVQPAPRMQPQAPTQMSPGPSGVVGWRSQGRTRQPPPTTSIYGAWSPVEGPPPGSSKEVRGLLPGAETTSPAGGHSKGQRTPALAVRGCRAPQGRHDTGVRSPGAD